MRSEIYVWCICIFFFIKTINYATTSRVLIRLMETALSALSSLLLSHLFTYFVFYINLFYRTFSTCLIYISRKMYIYVSPKLLFSHQRRFVFMSGPIARMEVFRFILSYPFLHYLTYLFSRLRPPLLRGWRQNDSWGPVILAAEGGVPPAWHDEQSRRRPSSLDG